MFCYIHIITFLISRYYLTKWIFLNFKVQHLQKNIVNISNPNLLDLGTTRPGLYKVTIGSKYNSFCKVPANNYQHRDQLRTLL